MGCGVKLGLDDRGGEGFSGDANCLTSPWKTVLCQRALVLFPASTTELGVERRYQL